MKKYLVFATVAAVAFIFGCSSTGIKDYSAAKEQVISGLMEKAKEDRNKEAEQMIKEWKKQREKD